jgi:hypothetical protein
LPAIRNREAPRAFARGAVAATALLILSGCSSSKPHASAPAEPRALAPPAASPPNPEFQPALARWNYYRQTAGLLPVQYDEELAKGAAAHSRYLVENQVPGADAFIYDGRIRSAMVSTGIREEPVGNHWYTERGSTAAESSYVIRSDVMPAAGGELIDALMTQGVNGLRLLDPQLALLGREHSARATIA